ncbi:conserved exported hypothetical protein [Candidatus Nitrospira nitrosa]|uniref:Uncharacterized protein n=1 Tax=Candidatus Nitrospira nitrosa TaxID=1742972 RepID=A0A0S4LCJ5_9BACT|nr:conserved exported hypothetical protein [Candidatus Nitrospira nitrosa]
MKSQAIIRVALAAAILSPVGLVAVGSAQDLHRDRDQLKTQQQLKDKLQSKDQLHKELKDKYQLKGQNGAREVGVHSALRPHCRIEREESNGTDRHYRRINRRLARSLRGTSVIGPEA